MAPVYRPRQVVSNAGNDGQPCIGASRVRVTIDGGGNARRCAKRARPGERAASGPKEPHHASSVSAQAVEPKSYVDGRRRRVPAKRHHGDEPGRRSVGIAMAESNRTFLPCKPSLPCRRPEGVPSSTARHLDIQRIQPGNTRAFSLISRTFSNHRSAFSFAGAREIRLKSSASLPTFTPYRDVAWKSSACIAPDGRNLSPPARCPDGFSGAVRCPDPFPLAPP
jgi:hypothetical protein